MDSEYLHQAFSKVVDASFAFTMAFNAYGADSEQAHAANDAYVKAMQNYKQTTNLTSSSWRWDVLCHQHPSAPECRIYDV